MRPETIALLEKASKSIQAAKTLKADGFPGFAASRGYYALFYAAEALLVEKGLSYNSHAAVISAFGKLFSKTGELDPRFHRYLLDAQDIRNVGDYGIGQEVAEELVDATIRWAEELLAAVDNYLK